MVAAQPSSFHCSNCNAFKVEAGPETVDREITCRCCEAPLIGREGNLVIKHFLLRKAGRVQKWGTRQPNQVKLKRPLPCRRWGMSDPIAQSPGQG